MITKEDIVQTVDQMNDLKLSRFGTGIFETQEKDEVSKHSAMTF